MPSTRGSTVVVMPKAIERLRARRNSARSISRPAKNISSSLPSSAMKSAIGQGQATNEVIDLTVQDALERGLKYNLGLYFSERATEQVRAERIRSLAKLMPVVNASVTEEVQKINLKAFGFNFPGFPSSVVRSD